MPWVSMAANGTGSLVFIDDVTANRSSRMDLSGSGITEKRNRGKGRYESMRVKDSQTPSTYKYITLTLHQFNFQEVQIHTTIK